MSHLKIEEFEKKIDVVGIEKKLKVLRDLCQMERALVQQLEAGHKLESNMAAWHRGRIAALSDVIQLIDEMGGDNA